MEVDVVGFGGDGNNLRCSTPVGKESKQPMGCNAPPAMRAGIFHGRNVQGNVRRGCWGASFQRGGNLSRSDIGGNV